MFVYNITIKIDPLIEAEWVQLQQQEPIPAIMKPGLFTDYNFYRLLEQNEKDGITYIARYFASSLEHYITYINDFAEALHQEAFASWADKSLPLEQ